MILSGEKIAVPKPKCLQRLFSLGDDGWGGTSLDGSRIKEEQTRDLTFADVEFLLQALVNNKHVKKVNLQGVQLGGESHAYFG